MVKLFTIISLLLFTLSGFSQTGKRTPAKKGNPSSKSVVPSQPKNPEDILQEKIEDTLTETEQWKEQTYEAEKFKVLFPRRSVKEMESIFDESLGKVNVITHLSLGDNGVFAVGTFPIPYTVTDESVISDFYQQTIKDVLPVEEYKVSETKEIKIQGKSAWEVTGISLQDKDEKATMRILLSGKNVFFVLAMPIISENLTTQVKLRNRAKFEKETLSFLNSFVELERPIAVNSPSISPVFKASYRDGIFHSDYFNFSIRIPANWVIVSPEDVESMRESGKDVLKANSDLKIPSSSTRRNLFYFASKPLGSYKNATISCNLTLKPTPNAGVRELAEITEREIKKVSFFTIARSTEEITLGTTTFVGFEAKGSRAEEEFQNLLYFTSGKEYALGFTLTYYDQEQKKILLDLLTSMKFN